MFCKFIRLFSLLFLIQFPKVATWESFFFCYQSTYLLKEGEIYELSVFDVVRRTSHFKLSGHPFLFSLTTRPVWWACWNNILHPNWEVRFQKYEQLIALANTNVDLPGLLSFSCFYRAIAFWVGNNHIPGHRLFKSNLADVFCHVCGIMTIFNDESKAIQIEIVTIQLLGYGSRMLRFGSFKFISSWVIQWSLSNYKLLQLCKGLRSVWVC